MDFFNKNKLLKKMLIRLLAFLIAIVCADDTDMGKQKLTIALLLPQDYIRLRHFRSCINSEIKAINSGNWSFLSSFYIERYTFTPFWYCYQLSRTIMGFLFFQMFSKQLDNYATQIQRCHWYSVFIAWQASVYSFVY